MRILNKEIKSIKVNIGELVRLYNQKFGTGYKAHVYRPINTSTNNTPVVIEPFIGHNIPQYYALGPNILYYDDTEKDNINDFVTFLSNLRDKKVDIKSDDKIYFSKSSSYPRHRLANFTDNKRTIKKDKANYIVLPNNTFSFKDEKYNTNFLNFGNEVYHLQIRNFYIYGTTVEKIIEGISDDIIGFKTNDTEEFIKRYLEKTLGLQAKPVLLKPLSLNSDVSKHEDLIQLFEDYSEKLILESHLDKYINSKGEVLELDEEKFNMMNKMLQDPTGQSVGLALRMMNSFDSTTYLIPLSLLILFNIHNISRNKEWNTVGMKVLRRKLNFITPNTVFDVKSKIRILNMLTDRYCQNEDDRETIRKYGMPMIKGVVDNFINTELKGVNFINKYEVILE